MVTLTDIRLCCGCTACQAVCPREAISLVPDALGFKYPKVDMDRCTDCGLCEKVCAFVRPLLELQLPVAKAARNKDEQSLMRSRSGAVFPVLAEHILSDGGAVYGAVMDEKFRVFHKRAVTLEEADLFRGSKYTQSDMGNVYKAVLDDLKKGITVLFSGTPCQVHGLSSYVPSILREKLILADVVCHGVPSPYVWRDYILYQERLRKGKVVEANFRDKNEYGWKEHRETYRVGDKLYTDMSYTYLFYKHIMLRPSCTICPYADIKRVSDITLGDFWGWQNAVPGFNDDDKGVSLVLLNTEKGRHLFSKCESQLFTRDVQLSDCLQPNLQHPTKPHHDTDAFTRDFTEKGLTYVMKRYGDKGWRYMVYSTYMNIKRTVKKWLKR